MTVGSYMTLVSKISSFHGIFLDEFKFIGKNDVDLELKQQLIRKLYAIIELILANVSDEDEGRFEDQ
jgi:hypothetical protein